MPPLRILTWHVHGAYLAYLAEVKQHRFYLPMLPDRPEGYGGRSGNADWPANLIEVPAAEVKNLDLDCILFQSHKNYLQDQYEILSADQQRLPRIFLEHDPPRQTPTDTRHPVDDPDVLLVHVTAFNALMWDNGRTPTLVIPHGVKLPEGARYTGEEARGLSIVNGLGRRGRRLGADVFAYARSQVPLDLVGMETEAMGGRGEIPHRDLPAFAARYRFLFNPIRYTSLGLSVCEAMMLGMPIIGLATTEMAVTIENGVSGYVETDLDSLVERMLELLDNHGEARRLGEGARRYAEYHFHIRRFVKQWEETFREVTGRVGMLRAAVAPAEEPADEPAEVST